MTNPVATRIAAAFTKPSRTAMPKTPDDYGMAYERVSFPSRDGIRLSAWRIQSGNAESDKLAILNHPLNCSKYGFVPEGPNARIVPVHVEFMLTAKRLVEDGYEVLAYDLRNHGESAASPDGLSGVGAFEWKDAVGAMDYVNGDASLKGKRVALVNHCMGANSAIIAMSKHPDAFARVKALVAVQPISMKYMAQKFIGMFGGGASPADVDEAIRQSAGISLDDMSPMRHLRDLKVPVLYAQVRQDSLTSPCDLEDIVAATPTEREMLWIEGDLHRFDGYNFFGQNPERMLSFLARHLS